jgi:hypothetical protein
VHFFGAFFDGMAIHSQAWGKSLKTFDGFHMAQQLQTS